MTINYQSNIPLANDSLATSQPQFLNNFAGFYAAFLQDHVALDSVSEAGYHTVARMLEQKNSFQTDLGEISIYAKKVEGQSDQLFLKYQGQGQEIQLTTYQIYSLNPITKGKKIIQHQYFTFFPGNLLIYFGDIVYNNNIKLFPTIAKRIITVSLCPTNTFPSFIPSVKLIKDNNGFFTDIVMHDPFFGKTITSTLPTNLFYCVWVNI